jgi:hypothetical protein
VPNKVSIGLFAGLAALVWLLSASAQEGYPLDGTWRGEWGSDPGPGNHVVIVMKWDGKNINGTINPGPNSYPFTAAQLFPESWRVRFEATTRSGDPIVIEGQLEDIGSYNRSIEGSWTQDGVDHAFKITRE